MAGMTGLEPATSGVTGQRSNQLSYTPVIWCITFFKGQILLNQVTKNKTMIFITHDLNFSKNFDKKFILKDGKIVLLN